MTDLIVVGSLNLDLVAEVARLPRRARPSSAATKTDLPAARAPTRPSPRRGWATTSRSSAAWAPTRGRGLSAALEAEGVGVAHLRSDDAPSGVALIAVSPDGENTIIVSPGANARVGADDVAAAAEVLAGAR